MHGYPKKCDLILLQDLSIIACHTNSPILNKFHLPFCKAPFCSTQWFREENNARNCVRENKQRETKTKMGGEGTLMYLV